MIGSRVKHAKGIGTVTSVGAKGVTVDGEHKLPHGEYQPHEEEHDLPVIAEAYAKWRQRLPEHLAQGPRSKMAVTAALAATLDQHLAGQMDFDELTLHRLQAVIKVLKANKGPHLFSVSGSDGKPVEVGDSDVETYLQGFGLSRRGLEVYHANRSVHDEHSKTGDVGKAQKAAAARVKVSNPGSLVDPRLGPALEARQKRPQAMDAHAGGHRRFAAFTKQMAGGAGDTPDDDSEDDPRPSMTKAAPGATGLVAQQVSVAAHTTSHGVHVPQHQTTVWTRPGETVAPPARKAPHEVFEIQIRHEAHEHAAVFDAHGDAVAVATPGDTIAAFTAAEPWQLAAVLRPGETVADLPKRLCVINGLSPGSARGGVMTHNHPSGCAFSREDMRIAAQHEFRELRAVCPSGVWRAVPGGTGSKEDWALLDRDFRTTMEPADYLATKDMDAYVIAAGGDPKDGEHATGFDIVVFNGFRQKRQIAAVATAKWWSGGRIIFEPDAGAADGAGRHGGGGDRAVPPAAQPEPGASRGGVIPDGWEERDAGNGRRIYTAVTGREQVVDRGEGYTAERFAVQTKEKSGAWTIVAKRDGLADALDYVQRLLPMTKAKPMHDATQPRFYVRMKMTPPTELLKRALRVDVVEEKQGGKTVGAVLTCEGRKWTLKALAKGGAYLRCEDGLPIPLHVICSGLEDARQVVESTTKRLGEGKAPMRGVFRLDDASVPSHVGV